ncbi:NAD(P)/FAD-dependent oxidoreductase [soil metagenome]
MARTERRPRVGIIGAGPAGLSAAYRLTRAGCHVTVFEAGKRLGGLAQTVDLWDQRVDLGSHIFGTHHRDVLALWTEVLASDVRAVPARRGVLTERGVVPYPIGPVGMLRHLGWSATIRAGLSALNARLPGRQHDDRSAEGWITARYGRQLYTAFFEHYGKKLWGIPCGAVDATFARALIGDQGTPITALWRAMTRGVGSKVASPGASTFPYPNGGTGVVWERMAQAIVEAGGTIALNAAVRRLVPRNDGTLDIDVGGTVTAFDYVISSMPITALLDALPSVPAALRDDANALHFRNTVLVYLHVDATDVMPYVWLYLYPPSLRAGRVTNFREWGKDPGSIETSTSIVAVEFWCNDDDALWRLDEAALRTEAEQELRSVGLLHGAMVLDAHVFRLRHSHPVFAVGFQDRMNRIVGWLRGIPGLETVGRQGTFTFDGMADSMRMGLEAANRILDRNPSPT